VHGLSQHSGGKESGTEHGGAKGVAVAVLKLLQILDNATGVR
jgi:hypothetical protein